jgi:hypothetical protein
MTYNFCTLFDSNYLTRGLALYYSLEKHCADFHLYIFAFDEKCYQVLRKINLNKATIISLTEFEDEQLLKVKPSRNNAEYCWTSTSSTILYLLQKYKVEMCTYLDADIFFYSSPKPIFDELGSKSILITKHRYSPQYNKEVKSGKYCVQFITFKNDENGLKALKWWRERCIEWCYARYEDGKFGDQLYLDDWTERFEGVQVLQHLGGGIASWNIQQYEFSKVNNRLIGTEIRSGNKFEVIFYHFHYLKFFTNGKVELGRRTLSKNVIDIFYKPYVRELDKLKSQIKSLDESINSNGLTDQPISWKTPILFLYRKAKGVYNIFDYDEMNSRP